MTTSLFRFSSSVFVAVLALAACGAPTDPGVLPVLSGSDTVGTGDVQLADAVTPVEDATAGDGDHADAAQLEDATAEDVATADTGPDVPACDPAQCQDDDACTDDACDPKTGACVHAPKPGCGSTLAPCASNADCKQGVCDIAASSCVACLAAADCGPGALCVDKLCKAAPPCQSDSQCKATQQVCSKAAGVCVDCNDKVDCAAGQACVDHACVAAPKTCASSKDCPNVCDKSKGTCVGCVADADCPAASFCNAEQQCQPDVCAAPACANGQVFACKANGGGYEAGKTCGDGNPCTDDVCQAAVGCVFPPNTAPCDDGNACTSGDACFGAKCASSGTVACDDQNPCTDDSCKAVGGCQYAPNNLQCDDGNNCTTGDKCAGGKCQGTGGPNCDDGNPCTDDGCSNNQCTHANNAAGCDDGQGCTGPDKCAAGKCTAGPAKSCDDGNTCTDDACDAKTGSCTHVKKAGCATTVSAPCVYDSDCPGGTVCDTAVRACVECVVTGSCPAGNICQKHQCKPAPACASDVQCKATKQVCNLAAKVCVDCNATTDCAADQQCVQNACVPAKACKSSKDCPSVCHTGKGFCVECLSSLDCAAGLFCNAQNQCETPLCKTQACLKSALFVCKGDGGGYELGKSCSDGNTCTDDTCDAVKGCVATNNTATCSATAACSGKCSNGACMPKGPYLFDKTYGDSSEEDIERLLGLPDGGFVLVGARTKDGKIDGLLTRVDAAGGSQWSKTYGGTGTDRLFDAVLPAGGGVTVAGYSNVSGKGDEALLLRLKDDGGITWQATFGGAYEDRIYALVGLGDGYLLAGRSDTKTAGSDEDGWVVRTDAAGKEKWNEYYGGTGYDAFYGGTATTDGGFALIGETKSKSTTYDIWLLRLDKNGGKQWEKTWGSGDSDAGYTVLQLPDGGFAFVGQLDDELFLARTNAAGDELWHSAWGTSTGETKGYGLLALPDGGFLATGLFYAGSTEKDNAWVVRTDAKGAKLWSDEFGGAAGDLFVDAAPAPYGGFALGGQTESKGSGGVDFWLVRVDAWGNSTCSGSGSCAELTIANCDDGNACTLDACSASKGCTHEAIPGCCTKASDCNDGNSCTTDACASNVCKNDFVPGAGCCNPYVFAKDFEDGELSPLNVSNSSSYSKWQVSTAGKAYTGKGALYYGNTSKKSFDDGDTYGYTYLPEVPIPPTGKTALELALYVDTEKDPKYDKFWIDVTPAGGSATTVWSKSQPGFATQTWQKWTIDLSAYAGKSVKVTLGFDAVDSTSNDGEGVYVDDLKIVRTCP